MNKRYFLFCSMMLTACGYHLRGDLPALRDNIYLVGATPQLTEQFSNVLELSKSSHLVETNSASSINLHIIKEDMRRRVLSLSSRGRANEFELVYSLRYDLLDNANQPLLRNQSIEVRREYFNNQQDILAKDNEETVIRNEMYQQAVQSILSQVRYKLGNR